MANDKQTILEKFGRIQAGLNNLAGDIRILKEGIRPRMSQEDVDEITAQAETLAASIESLAAETPDAETPPAEEPTIPEETPNP